MSGLSPAGCWMTQKRLESWAKAAKDRALNATLLRNGSLSADSNNSPEEFNSPNLPSSNISSQMVSAERTPSLEQPLQTPTHIQQSRPHLCRTPSISSQSSLESSNSRQGHRGSSPQIRTFTPDGKAAFHLEAAPSTSYSVPVTSRSPSPLRAASLDMRCSSPGAASLYSTDVRTPSPSQSSLASYTGGSTSSCNSPAPASPRTIGLARCLSPLFIPNAKGFCSEPISAPPASPLGSIQPDLYLKKDGPLFVGGSSKESSLGRLHFRMSYDFNRSDLIIHLIEAHDLCGIEHGGFNDSYVRVNLSPEVDRKKRQTLIHRENPNPFFDQKFKFPVSHDELQSKKLLLQVLDYDRFSGNRVIGEVSLSMEEYDVSTETIEIWGEIIKNKYASEELQEILVSLSYLPSAERLTVVILKARNLYMSQFRGNIDSFVKVHLSVNGKKIKKRKTTVKKNNQNPAWNEALSFSLSSNLLKNATPTIEIYIVNQSNELMGTSPILGSCVLGPNQTGPEKEHWLEMVKNSRNAVPRWHTIRCDN